MSNDATSEIAYAARVLKTPTITSVFGDLADTARGQGWTYEEYLAAVLGRQVADREASGIQVRTRAARFPQVNIRLTGGHSYCLRGPQTVCANIALGGQ